MFAGTAQIVLHDVMILVPGCFAINLEQYLYSRSHTLPLHGTCYKQQHYSYDVDLLGGKRVENLMAGNALAAACLKHCSCN